MDAAHNKPQSCEHIPDKRYEEIIAHVRKLREVHGNPSDFELLILTMFDAVPRSRK